jgi:hypothetical protein
MPIVSSTSNDKVRSFWDRYVKLLHDSGIKPPSDRWFVLRAEKYIQAHPNRKLAEHRPSDVDAYLADVGRQGGLKDWQFRQVVDAIQKLFELAGADWLAQVDWDHWRASARSLESSHPTVARDYQPATVSVDDNSSIPFATIRKAHAALLDRVRTAVRRRGYAIKTEQTYLHWIMRFIGFLGNADPTQQGGEGSGLSFCHPPFFQDAALLYSQ